jgi:hypothetical protein
MAEMTTTGRRSRRDARNECRSGVHRYGGRSTVGGGILRRVCLACGAISIDLTAIEEPLAVRLLGGSGKQGTLPDS